MPSKEFNEVLEAVPSEQVRVMARDALGANKKVKLAYEVTAVELTITDPTGANRPSRSRLQWG